MRAASSGQTTTSGAKRWFEAQSSGAIEPAVLCGAIGGYSLPPGPRVALHNAAGLRADLRRTSLFCLTFGAKHAATSDRSPQGIHRPSFRQNAPWLQNIERRHFLSAASLLGGFLPPPTYFFLLMLNTRLP